MAQGAICEDPSPLHPFSGLPPWASRLLSSLCDMVLHIDPYYLSEWSLPLFWEEQSLLVSCNTFSLSFSLSFVNPSF